MKRTPLYMAMAGLTLSAAATFTQAQDQVIEEVIVTGSYIPGSPEDAASPIDVITSDDLAEVGSPSTIEMIRNLGVTSGNIGETNQFQPGAQNAAGVTNVNLRGLGGARTLVLFNGKRQVATQGLGVDLSALPSTAIGRMEVLKDGAAALYGSDAMAGVVNFITRENFEGLELRGSYKDVKDAGDYDLGFIYGLATDNVNWTLSGEYEHRDQLGLNDRDWGLPTYAENPEAGWSGIGNPGTIYPLPSFAAFPDPECNALGGFVDGASCRFQYTYFDNLTEEQDTQKWFSELNWAINQDTNLHIEALYGKVEVDRFTSPSYPPQSLFGGDRLVSGTHPGLVDMASQYPALFTGGPVFVVNRYAGVSGINGEPEKGARETEQYRLGVGLDGDLFNGELSYDVSVTWSKRDRYTVTDDMYVERMAFALDGLGGPNCNPATGTAGVGDCMYYNPFSNAIQYSAVNGAVNPNYTAAVANDPALLDWLTYELPTIGGSELLVFDATFNGETGIELAGGNIGWAAGVQTRRDRYETKLGLNNLEENACPFNDPQSVLLGNTASLSCSSETGLFAFLSGGFESRESRRTYAIFTEFAAPVTDNFNVNLAVRFEDYGGLTGSTVDPKLSLRWQIIDALALRGSISTTFRGPAQSILSGQGTTLSYIPQATAFKAVDTYGNPNLKPESALSSNLGLLLDLENFRGSIDYWRFDVTDPHSVESATQILALYGSEGCATTVSALCTQLQQRIQFSGASTSLGDLERIDVNWFNGSDFEVHGVDLFGEYTLDLGEGELAVGGEFTYLLGYEYEDFYTLDGIFLAEGGDYAGFLNDGFPPSPLPELKGNLFAKYRSGIHSASLIARYVSGYDDANAPIPALDTIDAHLTWDLNYNLSLMDDALRVSFSVFNIADEDPPQAATDLNYDGFTHSPFGRMIKLGAVYHFDF
ncbi:MAG: TonB-dependent receptor plug domain-containing protein [Cellvibrionaceae bacterium]